MDCGDGRKIDDPILVPFLEKLKTQEILPSKMKEWVIYFSDKDVDEMFEGWNKSYLTEVGLSEEDQGVPYGRVYLTETTCVYLPRLTPVQDDWMEFRVMYAEQLLLDNIDAVKVYISYEAQGEKISKSSMRLMQVLLKRAHSHTVVVLSSYCNNSCIHDAANPLLTLETCGIVNGKNYTIKCEHPAAVFDDKAFNGTEATHFDKITTPEFQVQLPAQLNHELQNILDWLLKRIGQRMRNYMEMAFKKNRFRKTNMELYNKVNLQISKIKGGISFEAAKSANLIYNSLFDLNVYLNVTNTPYTFDKFHTFNLYLSFIGRFSKWQLDTTKYANFFEPLKELCLSQISIGNSLLKPATKIFELEEGVYDLNGVICHDNILYVISGMPTINMIKSGLYDHSNCDFDTVFVLAKKNLTINEDLKIPGKNLIIFSPTWVIFKEHVINLSGRSGGTDGKTESGQSGGDFYGFGVRFDRSDFLKIVSNGGDGSRGINVTARVTDDRFTEEKDGKCIIKKGKEKDILAEYGATYGGSSGSAGSVTLKILRSPARNYTIVRLDGNNGKDGKTGNIIFQCNNKQEVTFPANNLTDVKVISKDIQKMNEAEILELFRKVIRKNSRRLSYDVLNFYKDIWTAPIIGESLDSTLNDFLNSSDFTDSKDFYEITSQILHTQIKQTCNMTETQKILLDFALATIRMTAPAENVLPSVIDVTSYLKEVSNTIGKKDVANEYFRMKDEKFRKIIEEANYYLKTSLLPSLNWTMGKTHKYLVRNANAYLTSSNLNEGRKYQQNLVSNNLLRYLTEILRHVQTSLEDFVRKEESDPSASAHEEGHDSEKLEKKLYYFRYLRNNVTANEMNAMSEFIKLLKKTVEEDSSASGNKCAACGKELDHLIMVAKNNMPDSAEICEKCITIITQNVKRFKKQSVRLNERDFAETDLHGFMSNGNSRHKGDFHNMDDGHFWQSMENENDRNLEKLESGLLGSNNCGPTDNDFYDEDDSRYFTNWEAQLLWPVRNDHNARLRCKSCPTCDGCPGHLGEIDVARPLSNSNGRHLRDYPNENGAWLWIIMQIAAGGHHNGMNAPWLSSSSNGHRGRNFKGKKKKNGHNQREFSLRCRSCPTCAGCPGEWDDLNAGQLLHPYVINGDGRKMPQLSSSQNENSVEIVGICDDCPCGQCPFCPGCKIRNFGEIDEIFLRHRNNFDALIEANSPSTDDFDNIFHPVRSNLEKRSSVRSNKKRKKSPSPQDVSGMKSQNMRDSGCDGCKPQEWPKLRSFSSCDDCLSKIEDKRKAVAKLIAEGGEQCSAEGLKLCKSTVNIIKNIIPEAEQLPQDRAGGSIHLRCPDCNDTLDFFTEKLSAEINRCEKESSYNHREVESRCPHNEGIVFHMKGCDPEIFSRTFDEIRGNFLKEFSQFVAADEAHSNELGQVQTKFAYLLTNIYMLLQEGIPVSGASLNNILYVTDSLIKFKDLKMEYQKRMTELHDFSETDMYDLFSSSLSMQNERLGVTSKWLGQLKKLMPWMKKVINFLGADQKFQEVNERITEAIRLVSEIVHNVRLVERHRELRNYVQRVRTIEKKEKTTGVGQAILDMKNIFHNTFMKEIFRKVVIMAQNWVFPLTKSHLAIQNIKNHTHQSYLAAVSDVVEEHKKSIMLYTTVHASGSFKNDVPFYEWSVRARPTLMHDLFSGKPVILVSEILDGGKKNSLMAKDFEVNFVAGKRQPPGTQEKIDEALKGHWLNLTHSGISYFKFGSRIYRRLTETFTFRHPASTVARAKTKSVMDYVLSPYTTWVLTLEPDSEGKLPQNVQDRIGSIELVGTGRFVINCADIPDVNQYFIPLNDYSRRNEK